MSDQPTRCPTCDCDSIRIEMVRELREALGMFSGAMPITPEAAWADAISRVYRLLVEPVGTIRVTDNSYWAGSTANGVWLSNLPPGTYKIVKVDDDE